MITIAGPIGIDQGDVVLFSDYEDGGAMWTGEGQRVCVLAQNFSQKYKYPPAVHCSLSMFDMDHHKNPRMDVRPINITAEGFEIYFTTWGDTHIARVRAAWMAIGALDIDDWNLEEPEQ